MYELKPDLVIETGTAAGGSAFYMASLFDILGRGRIVTIDIDSRKGRPQHGRITYLAGSSVDPGVLAEVKTYASSADKILVILDSDHSERHVTQELELYKDFVSRGSYLIVEDSNVNGHPVAPEFGPGPMEAVEKFMQDNREFVIDSSREKYFVTFNPKGYLRRL